MSETYEGLKKFPGFARMPGMDLEEYLRRLEAFMYSQMLQSEASDKPVGGRPKHCIAVKCHNTLEQVVTEKKQAKELKRDHKTKEGKRLELSAD